MKNENNVKEKRQMALSLLDKLRHIKWTRERLEMVSVVVIAICACCVPLFALKTTATLTYANGQITYHGQVDNATMNGQGKLTYANGDYYEGQFSNGTFDGQGIYHSATGWRYEGAFTNGQANGQGTLTTEDGTVYKGTFAKGIYQK